MTLFIHHLPPEGTQVDLLELFEKYGAVKHIFFPTHWKTDQAIGFAFLEMSVKAHESVAMFELNGLNWMTSKLQINQLSS
jgi:RNA recognition motif-containing protein